MIKKPELREITHMITKNGKVDWIANPDCSWSPVNV